MYYNLHLAYLIFLKKLLIWDSEIYINSNYFLSYKALEFRWSFRASVESFSTETYGGVGVKKVYLNKAPNYVSTLSYVYTINSSFFPASKLCIISANLSMVRIRYIHK